MRRARRGGHIPGAVNTPYRDFLVEGSGPDGDYIIFKGLDGIKKVGAMYDTLFFIFQLPNDSRRGGGRGGVPASPPLRSFFIKKKSKMKQKQEKLTC